MIRRSVVGALVVGVTVVPVGAVLATDTGAKACTAEAEPLPEPGEYDYLDVVAGDPSGRYLVGADVLWVDGEAQVLTGISDGDTYAEDVNSSGVVVGRSGARGWTYADGAYTELPGPADAPMVVPTAINATGDVVGYQARKDSVGRLIPERALYWPAGDPDAVQVLDAPDPAAAEDISDTGVIVGNLTGDKGFPASGYVWQSPDDEGAPLADANGETDNTVANAISPNGTWLAGGYYDTYRAVRWNLETGAIQRGPGDNFMGYVAVNDSGDAVTSGDSSTDYGSSVIVKPNGEQVWLLGEGRYDTAAVLPERDADITAAGYSDFAGAAVFRGC